MHRNRIALVLTLLLTAACGGGDVRQVTFEGETSEYKWTLTELDPNLPSDWTGYEYLVLEMRVSSPQRFFLNLYSGDQVQRRRMHPLANAWIRAAVPLQYFRQPNREGHDLASVGKVPRNSFWIGTNGQYGPLDAIDAIGVLMERPFNTPTLELRSVALAKEDPGSEVLEPKPLVDRFGQWIPVDWPRKIQTLEQLEQEWAAEGESLSPGGFNYSEYGGYNGTQAEATGFFRVERVDGKWWFVDPDGRLFFSTASTGIRSSYSLSRVEGRESYFAELPPAELTSSSGGSARPAGFYLWNLFRRFGDGWNAKWIDVSFRRMDAWGFNTIGNWSDPQLWDAGRKVYVVNLTGWGMRTGYLGMPDVYAEDWPRVVDEAAARQCAPRKDDPYLLGYFVANEPPWPGRESLMVDMILEGEPGAIQARAKEFLAAGDTPERRREFIYEAFERYLEVINAAIKKHDPNHLNLGLRFGGHAPPDEMLELTRDFDVYSMNSYSVQVDPEVLAKVYEVTGRPIIIGEFHFGVPANGLAAGLVQVSSEAERGAAYRYYVEQAASFPALIGTSWFQWLDQPVTGRSDGENYNIGLVDVTDRPYPEFLRAVVETHKNLYDVHSGRRPPTTQRPAATRAP